MQAKKINFLVDMANGEHQFDGVSNTLYHKVTRSKKLKTSAEEPCLGLEHGFMVAPVPIVNLLFFLGAVSSS